MRGMRSKPSLHGSRGDGDDQLHLGMDCALDLELAGLGEDDRFGLALRRRTQLEGHRIGETEDVVHEGIVISKRHPVANVDRERGRRECLVLLCDDDVLAGIWQDGKQCDADKGDVRIESRADAEEAGVGHEGSRGSVE